MNDREPISSFPFSDTSTRPHALRSQSHRNPSSEDLTERTTLLRSSASQGRLQDSLLEGRGRGQWAQTLRRKSAAISDLLSGHSHSAWTLPAVGRDIDELEVNGDSTDEERVQEGGSRKKRGVGVGYDGEFRQELEGEGGNGVRQWYDNFHSESWVLGSAVGWTDVDCLKLSTGFTT